MVRVQSRYEDQAHCLPTQDREKLVHKHRVELHEVREVLLAGPRIRFGEQGNTPGEDVYAAFGRTWDGRYLAVFFVYKADAATAVVISARDMTAAERKRYGRK